MIENIVKEAFAAGVRLHVVEGKLNFAAKKGSLSDELRSRIVTHKAAIIELLTRIGDGGSVQTPITRLENRERVPLSFAQQRLWFIDQLEGGSAQYNMPAALRLRGRLDVEAMQRALDTVVERHEILRTTYREEEGAAVQVVQPFRSVTITRIDGTEDLVQSLAAEEAGAPFDLGADLMLRATLVRLAEEEHVLLFTMHHIASDGWSMGILIREFVALYQGNTLPALPIQYADFAAWQRAQLQDANLDYWKQRLDGIPQLHSLPLDKPRGPRQNFLAQRHWQQLDRPTVDALQQLAREHDATLFMVLQSAFALLLSRWSGADDVVMAVPSAGRSVSGVDPLIGFFINTLVFRTDLSRNESFRELLGRARKDTLDAYAHQQVPFDMLVDELKPERALSYNPLAQIKFVLQNFQSDTFALPGLEIENVPPAVERIRFDLDLTATESPDGLQLCWSFKDELFERATIERMAESFRVLVNNILRAPETPVRSLPLLDATAQAELLAMSRGEERLEGRDVCVQRAFEAQAAKTPDAVALRAGSRTLTYEELNAQANRLAHYLIEQGVERGARVGLYVERSPEVLIGMLGILKAGAAYVPFEPSNTAERLRHIIDNGAIEIVLVQSHLAGKLPVKGLDVVTIDDAEWLDDYEATNPEVGVALDDSAYVIYTSGSTGVPKGVEITHGGLIDYLAYASERYYAAHLAGSLVVTSHGFDITVPSLYVPLLGGGSVTLTTPGEELNELAAALSADDNAYLLRMTPMHLTGVLALLSTANRQPSTANHVFVIGGESFPASLARETQTQFPNAQIYNHYGPTETVVGCAMFDVTANPHVERLPIGKPMANTQLYVLNDALQLAPTGVAGELHIGGRGVARGYVNQPELTAAKFIEFDGTRVYKTGDLVRRLPSGDLEFLGRLDDQIKIRGFRIELGEIESVLKKYVSDALVIARGEGEDKQLAAYVVGTANEETLRAALEQALPEYMVPGAICFLEAFPLNANGKIDRKKLPAIDRQESVQYVAPSTPTETRVAELWQEVLKLDAPVSVTANFFRLGGHSLLATRLLSRIARDLGCAVPVRALFEHPTVRDLSAHLDLLRKDTFVPLAPVARDRALPASFAQQRLWFIDQLEQGSAQYNMPAALLVEGPLDRDALQRTLDTIVARHEVLRTRFIASGEECLQEIDAPRSVVIREPAATSLAEVEKLAREEAARPFDLSRDLMLRATLVPIANSAASTQHTALLLTLHHIAADGWSLGLLANELAALYDALSKGEENPLAPLAVQYADFAHWQRAQLEGATLERQLGYWKQQLAGVPAVHSIPLDRPRPAQQSFAGGNHRTKLDAATQARLAALANEHGTTMFMLLETAFALLLARWSQSADVVLGSPVAGRNHKDVEPLVGFFVNTLVLRTQVDGAMPFVELLARNGQTILDAFAHQDVSFDALVDELKPARSLSHSPLYQVLFALQNNERFAFTLPGLAVSDLGRRDAAIRFDLQLAAGEEADGLLLSWSYATSLFDAATIARMAASFEVLLRAIADDPRTAAARLPLLTGDDRRQIAEWNDTDADVVSACVHELFEVQAAQTPGATAVVCGGESLTYRELDARANRIAHWLLARGIRPDARVGISVNPSADMLAGLLGILKSGAAYVPLSPSLPEARLRYMREDAGVEIVLDETTLREASAFGPESKPETNVAPQNLAYVIYTSGTTGQPKGVMIEHEAAVNFTTGFLSRLELERVEKWLLLTGITFDIAFFEWFGCLTSGGTCVIADAETQSDPMALRALLDRERFQLVQTTPSRWTQLLDAGWRGQDDLVALCGGEALPPALQERLVRVTGALWNCYGPTEATVWSLVGKVERGQSRVVLGTGLPNYKHYVLANGEPCAIGAIGELHIGGPSLARGYLNRPELTAEKFVVIGGERLYRTGDLVRHLADGSLAFIGRTDDQVKIRGHRIELAEIEAQLARIDGVREAVVAAKGEGSEKYLAAYFVGDVATEELKHALQRTLPEAMIPSAFVSMDALPLNANGKVDRKALPEPVRQSVEYVAPEGETETRIAEVWQRVLKLEGAVSATANFFELGGHSLLATRIASALGVSVRALFEHATVRALAAHLDAVNAKTHEAIPVASRDGLLPLSYAQQRLWFIDRLGEGSAHYNIPLALHLRGTLNRKALQQTFDAIVARHEVLRTRFAADGEEAVQEIRAARTVSIGELDFSALGEAARKAALERVIREQAAHPFRLDRDLMLRVGVVRLAPGEHALLLTLHHIAADGWSVDVLVREFATLYGAFARGEQNPLEPLSIQYADYASWQRAQSQEEQLAYWKTQLADLPRVHSLPLDKPRPAQQRFDGASLVTTLDAGVTAKLQSLVQAQQASLFMALESAFALLIGRWSRSDDVVLGTPIAGREHPALEPLIGFFVNTLVLRTRLTGTQSFRDLLRDARQTALDAFAHQSIPFETLVDELKPERSLSHSALFQILFSLARPERDVTSLHELDVRQLVRESTLTKFDLNLTAIEDGGRLRLRWQYATSLFEEATIARMAAAFDVLLRAIVATPDRAIYELPLVQDEPSFGRGPVVDRGATPCVHAAFEAQAAKTPEAVAIHAGERTLTYREVNEQSNRIAHALLAKNAGSRVGLYFERSPEVLVGLLGILKAGLAYVPFEPGNTSERLRHIVENAGITHVVADPRLMHRLPAGVERIEAGDATHNPNVIVRPEETAYVMYTSGSTGVPKGVEIAHAGLLDYCAFAADHYYAAHLDGSLVVTSHGFDITVPSLYVPLLRGGSVTLTTPGQELLELADALRADDRAYLLRMTPMHLTGVLELGARGDAKHVFVIGGEAFPATLARELQAQFPHAQIYNHYGPTETVVGCAIFDVTANLGALHERIPIGRPMANTRLSVLNAAMQPVPVGVPGELHIGGAGVAKGYVNQPDVTAAKFVDYDGARVYKSGDLVRWLPTGDLEFLGRADDQIKIRGFRIEPGEIEAVLKSEAGVKDVLVVAQGESENRTLVAYVVGAAELEPALRARVKKALPDYMHPAAWSFLEAFPLNANGKIDRRKLPAVTRQTREYVAPKSGTETRLADIWRTLLRLDAPVSVTANFFELGGHSLLATRLASQIAVAFQCRVPIQTFFQYQDIRTLADFIDSVQLISNSDGPQGTYEDEGTL